MDNLGYLFSAYAVVWSALFFFLVILHKRQKKLENSINNLRKEVNS